VFQNGVFELGRGEFIEDEYAPLKYSNPIAARFDARVWSLVEELDEYGASARAEEYRADLVFDAWIERNLPVFSKYCEDWFPGDKEIRKWILKWFGYSMTVDSSKQKMVFFYGASGAGKGSLAQVLGSLVGEWNKVSIGYGALLDKFAVASCAGKLLVSIEEVEGSSKEHEARVAELKKMTGGESYQFQGKYALPIEMPFSGKILMQSNEILAYQDKAGSLKGRLIAVGFEHSFRGKEGSKTPKELILKAEGELLASVSALMWCANREKEDCFGIYGNSSRALQVGTREVISSLDVFSKVVEEYVEEDGEGEQGMPKTAYVELVKYYAESLSLSISSIKSNKVSQQAEKALRDKFGELKETRGRDDGGRRPQIKMGVKLNRDKILEDFPELEDDITGEFEDLKKALGLKQKTARNLSMV
jgi:phage/plasmid-associated DNA primase